MSGRQVEGERRVRVKKKEGKDGERVKKKARYSYVSVCEVREEIGRKPTDTGGWT